MVSTNTLQAHPQPFTHSNITDRDALLHVVLQVRVCVFVSFCVYLHDAIIVCIVAMCEVTERRFYLLAVSSRLLLAH